MGLYVAMIGDEIWNKIISFSCMSFFSFSFLSCFDFILISADQLASLLVMEVPFFY
jgi:hypothetical protein